MELAGEVGRGLTGVGADAEPAEALIVATWPEAGPFTVNNELEQATTLAQEVASKGVTVNTLSHGYVATEMVMAVREDIRQQIVAQIPVGRLGQPDEIAAAVAYLASDEAGFVTGSNLSINGGQHMF